MCYGEEQIMGNTIITGNDISIGNQKFDNIRENDCFYVDKTAFIKEWWDSKDIVTLITRPRRFGKTLNMSMLNCFFSNQYAGRSDLFDDLYIWKNEEYRKLQGKYPVIFLSFADVKQNNYVDAVAKIKNIIVDIYAQYEQLYLGSGMTALQKQQYYSVKSEMSDVTAQDSLKMLSSHLSSYYRKNVIILLDEYDTPMQEAYVHGYWDEFISFLRSLFNSTFKTNQYLERAVMTGITGVSKESMFSDLNNLNVVTTTTNEYSTSFGFTEDEVFASLDKLGLSDRKAEVKNWYDGFTFGLHKDIYNPWSIINYLDKKQLRPYWAATSSNGPVSKLLQTASPDMKLNMERLMNGELIVVNFDEQVVFNQLDTNESAVWSLLVAGGYLKVEAVEYRGEILEPWYHVSITNIETKSLFYNMFKGWFGRTNANYNEFVRALMKGSLKEMNIFMNHVATATFSFFDTGTHPSEINQPEKFYHGFVLGLISELRDIYEIKSNRESGYGRYDVMLIPRDLTDARLSAIVLEFKVHDSEEEKTLVDTAQAALRQIADKNYDAELIARGIDAERIRHYGFAFEGKKVLIM